jgi:putative membrane protein insertion efficiency factor
MNKHLIFIIVAIQSTATYLVAQPPPKGSSIVDWPLMPVKPVKEFGRAEATPNPRHEWDWLAFASYRFYKKHISSQDAISCTFEPSCSTYGLHAIRHLGAFAGIGATFDRLSRCHGWNRGAYDVEVSSGLNLDPIELIHPKQKIKKIHQNTP